MLKVALKGLRSHGIRLVLTAIAVVASVSFMCGTQVLTATISASFDKIFADVFADIDVIVRSSNTVNTGVGEQRALVTDEAIPTIRAVVGVRGVEGHVQGFVAITDKAGDPMGGNVGPPTFGLNWPTEPTLNGWRLRSGRPPTNPNEVVIDNTSANKAGYQVGDTVRIQTNKGAENFVVVGTAGFGATQNYAGRSAALFDTATAQMLLGEPEKFTWIAVAGDGVSQEDLRTRISQALVDATIQTEGVPNGATLNDVETITGTAFTSESQDFIRDFLGILQNFLLAMAGVALFVGTFIIYNTFSVIIAQRTRELALLRAMGASRAQVMLSVILEATVVGAMASLVGLGGGVLIAKGLTGALANAGFGPPIAQLAMPALAFVSSFMVGTLITVIAGILPAWKASRVAPVAAMRAAAIDTSGQSRSWLVAGTSMLVAGAILLCVGLFTEVPFGMWNVGSGFLCVFLGTAALCRHFVEPLSHTIGSPLRKITGRLARTNSARNPTRTAITASALMIGVGLVVMSAIVVQSIKGAFSNALDSTFVGDFVITSGSFVGFDPTLAQEINGVEGIERAVGFRIGFAQVSEEPTPIVGVDPDALQTVVKLDVVDGSLSELAENAIAVDKERAKEHGWTIGSEVSTRLIVGGTKSFIVGAIYDIPAQRRSGILMPLSTFEKNFPPEQQVDGTLYVKLDPDANLAAVRANLKQIVKRDYPAGKVEDLTEYKESQIGFLNVFLLIVTALLLLAIIIAFIGIVNTLLLSVYERTHEIGLLRAVGMARRQVRATVVWESVIISLLGTLLGTVLGFGFSWALVRALSDEQPVAYAVPYGQLVVLVLVGAVAGVIAAVYPAWRASRLNVLAAIATE